MKGIHTYTRYTFFPVHQTRTLCVSVSSCPWAKKDLLEQTFPSARSLALRLKKTITCEARCHQPLNRMIKMQNTKKIFFLKRKYNKNKPYPSKSLRLTETHILLSFQMKKSLLANKKNLRFHHLTDPSSKGCCFHFQYVLTEIIWIDREQLSSLIILQLMLKLAPHSSLLLLLLNKHELLLPFLFSTYLCI